MEGKGGEGEGPPGNSLFPPHWAQHCWLAERKSVWCAKRLCHFSCGTVRGKNEMEPANPDSRGKCL